MIQMPANFVPTCYTECPPIMVVMVAKDILSKEWSGEGEAGVEGEPVAWTAWED